MDMIAFVLDKLERTCITFIGLESRQLFVVVFTMFCSVHVTRHTAVKYLKSRPVAHQSDRQNSSLSVQCYYITTNMILTRLAFKKFYNFQIENINLISWCIEEQLPQITAKNYMIISSTNLKLFMKFLNQNQNKAILTTEAQQCCRFCKKKRAKRYVVSE